MGQRRWIHADRYAGLFETLRGDQLLILGHMGRSEFTFEALDRQGRLHLVWIYDHERIKRETANGPARYSVGSWQRIGPAVDLLDKSLRTGMRQ